MHLTALVKSPEHVCCRYRLAAFGPFLERAGYSLDLRPWPRQWLSRLLLRRELGHTDIVVLQRKLLPAWQLALLRRAARFLVFDFDDAVFLRSSYAARGSYSASRARGFAAAVRAADAVVAGNPFLQSQASLWADPQKIHLVRTCLDPRRYPLAEHTRTGGDVRLGWIGSSSTLRSLETARPLLEGLGRRLPGLSLKIICDRFLELSHVRVLRRRWAQATEAEELADTDIGVSWLPEDLWSRGKCSLKLLQYMAAGLPVVANPVGMQAQLVRHGETGFLARTPAEWADAVGRLAADPDLRTRLGQAGRRRVEAEFNVSVGAKRLVHLLDNLRHGAGWVQPPEPVREPLFSCRLEAT